MADSIRSLQYVQLVLDRPTLFSPCTHVVCRKVQEFPKGLHWFCPRSAIDDNELYFSEDLQLSEYGEETESSPHRRQKIDDARARRDLVFDSLQIFAFDGKDAAEYQNFLEVQLAVQLGQCDICIREFHRGRRDFKHKLHECVAVV